MKVDPVTLEGTYVRLDPLSIEHSESLYAVGAVDDIWRWTTSFIRTPEDMELYIETALDEQSRGTCLPFVTIYKPDDKIVGSTRFGNIDTHNRKVEIGWTWITPDWQRTIVNTEAKLLMLAHAFETWNCVRVELKTDAFNEKSRNAILRIGAKEEGILRQHMITDEGRFRDSVYFSIIDKEWNDVKGNLLSRLEKR